MLLLIRYLLILETPPIKIQPQSIANHLSHEPREDEQGEHHQRRLTKDKGQHRKKYPERGHNIGDLCPSQVDQLVSLIFNILNIRLFFPCFDRMNDGRENMGENRGEDRYDHCQYEGDAPEAKYICRLETPTLDHLKHSD